MTYLTAHGEPHYRYTDCPWHCGGHHHPTSTSGHAEVDTSDHRLLRKLTGLMLIAVGAFVLAENLRA